MIRDLGADEIECERTSLGYRFATDDFDTLGYWKHGWWQTTISYWVELFDAVETEGEIIEITGGLVVA